MIELDSMLSNLGLNRDQLIIIGILIGTDYNPGGVKGIGPKNALKLVKEYGTFENVLKRVEWGFETNPNEIFEFFKNPPVGEMEIEREKPDLENLREFMLGFDFSEKRVDKTFERLGKSRRNEGLQKWLK